MRLSIVIVALLLTTLLFPSRAVAQTMTMPEFGPSVTFAKGEEPVTIAGLRGKVVLVIFFQSWCGICNGWAPDLLKQMEQQYAGQTGYVLMAIKTDGGTPEEAKAFLVGKGATVDRWVVASDADKAYYQRMPQSPPLWGYVVVDPDGMCIDSGQGGMFYKEKDTKEFVLPTKRKQIDKLYANKKSSSLPAGKTYAPELARAVHFAETGRVASAVLAARSVGAAGKELETDLVTLLDARLDTLEAQARDEANAQRYTAFMALRDLTVQIKGLPAAKDAQKAVIEIAKDKTIQREQKSEAAWLRLMVAVEKQPKEKRQDALKASIPAFIKTYDGTHFARIAAEANAR